MKTAAPILCAFALFATAPFAWAQVPPRTEAGTTLVVPESHRALGQVYYIRYPSHSVQVTFTSDAPIERIIGTSLRVVGYVVVEERDGSPTGRLLAGGFRLPVRSLDSGIPLRNTHMQQPNFFDADRFPDILFEMTGSDDVAEVERDEHSTTYAMTLTGAMTIRDVTKTLEIPARITLLPESEFTRNAGRGDVLALRCRYSLERSEFGVAPGFVNAELTDTIVLDQTLICTTVSREERFLSMPDPARVVRDQRLIMLIRDLRDLAAASKHGETMLADYWDDADAMNTLAWNAVDTDHTDVRRLPFAERAALRAAELDAENADVLDTVAHVYYAKGDLAKAVEWQRKTIAYLESAGDPAEIVKTLHDYEGMAGEPLTEVAAMEVKDLPQGSGLVSKYVGTYELEEPKLAFTFIEADGKLLVEAGGQSAIPLLYQGGHEFRPSMQTAVKMIFEVQNEQATVVEIHQGRRVMKAIRVHE